MLEFLPRQEVSPELAGMQLGHPGNYIYQDTASLRRRDCAHAALGVFATGCILILSPKNAFDSLGQSYPTCHLHTDSDNVTQYCVLYLYLLRKV